MLARTAANRRRIADLYDGAAEELWSLPSGCRGWDLRTLLGHLVMPLVVPPHRVALRALRCGSVHAASSQIAAELGCRPGQELTGLLRHNADRVVPSPGVGPMGQFVDGCIHLYDAALPLGHEVELPMGDWELVLSWLPSRAARLGHVPRGLHAGVAWNATDCPWQWGAGALVEGPAASLALTMTGRAVGLATLSGPGLATVRHRLLTG
ncbi:MAG: maleylpyruvate isomerase N-terminal domain-containing protein [Austwickia sp.]|nr:maleylpyruvate isomerase N-terminal domain-containing protein [Austwickia sp.]MBK9101355.1 maleylpyruvate isomerase N-terminal domain-containing protein [Austwickia sp.]